MAQRGVIRENTKSHAVGIWCASNVPQVEHLDEPREHLFLADQAAGEAQRCRSDADNGQCEERRVDGVRVDPLILPRMVNRRAGKGVDGGAGASRPSANLFHSNRLSRKTNCPSTVRHTKPGTRKTIKTRIDENASSIRHSTSAGFASHHHHWVGANNCIPTPTYHCRDRREWQAKVPPQNRPTCAAAPGTPTTGACQRGDTRGAARPARPQRLSAVTPAHPAPLGPRPPQQHAARR